MVTRYAVGLPLSCAHLEDAETRGDGLMLRTSSGTGRCDLACGQSNSGRTGREKHSQDRKRRPVSSHRPVRRVSVYFSCILLPEECCSTKQLELARRYRAYGRVGLPTRVERGGILQEKGHACRQMIDDYQ